MKKFLSVLLLGLLMGAVSYPILFGEVKAQSALKESVETDCFYFDHWGAHDVGDASNCIAGSSLCSDSSCGSGMLEVPRSPEQ